MRFQDGLEKDLTLDQLIIETVESIPKTEEPEIPPMYAIPIEKYNFDVRYNNVFLFVTTAFKVVWF